MMTTHLASNLRRIAVLSFTTLLLAGCGGGEKATTEAPPPPVDSVQTLMLTYETVIMPDNKKIPFQIASDGTFVRLSNETGSWRLFDTKNRTITFVDQTAGTATEVSFDDALAERTKMLADAPSEGTPTATVSEAPGEPEKGHLTHRVTITVGSFTRELVLSEDPLLPGDFFAMKVVTDPIDPRYASIMRDVLPTLVRQNGTLLAETNRLEVPDGEPVTATTKLMSVTTIQLSHRAFALPENVTVTKKGAEAPATDSATDSTAAK